MTIAAVRRLKQHQQQSAIIMEGSASSINSRATAIRSILLAAWRAKLSDEEWEQRIRKILPRGVNGDVYDLADCLLKQALIGPVPNQLFISYLRHAVNCELVSHGAVIDSVAHQPINHIISRTSPASLSNGLSSSRTSPVICLLEFLKTFRDRISCKGSEIDCLKLCYSISQLIHWLLKTVYQALEIMPQNSLSASSTSNMAALPTSAQTSPMTTIGANPTGPGIGSAGPVNNNYPTVGITPTSSDPIIKSIDLCTEMIHYFVNKSFTKALLFISKTEYAKEFDDILRTVQLIQQKLQSNQSIQMMQDKLPHFSILNQVNFIFNSRDMHPSVVAAQQLRCLQVHRIRSTQVTSGINFEKRIQHNSLTQDSNTNFALFNSLYSLIAFDVLIRPARSHKLLASQIITITNFHTAPVNMTYCELIRICMIGFIDADKTSSKFEWAVFTFLKMPKLLIEINRMFKNSFFLQDQAMINRQIQNHTNTPLVTNFVEDLKLALERLCGNSPLIDEAENKCNCDFLKCLIDKLVKYDPSLEQLRSLDFRKFPKRQLANNCDSSSDIRQMMSKTEQVVIHMLKTLDSEQDPVELLSFLSQLVSGKQFEFTLIVAASTGRLHSLANKLMEHNEINRTSKCELPSKNASTQALIFDITFLILTYIAQQYGPDIITEDQKTTFSRWFHDCYNHATRINCPKEMIKNCNKEIVSSLIKQLLGPDDGVQTRTTNWQEACVNLPGAINEILIAWDQGVLANDDIVTVAERIKSKMCFFAVVIATWLHCHIKTLNETDKVKPLSLLHNLTRPSQHAKQQKQISNLESIPKTEHCFQRSSLMCSIIRKIYFELVPKGHQSSITMNPNAAGNDVDNELSSIHESSYQSVNDRFTSNLTVQEILTANIRQCLARGWIDHKSLNSLNSLLKMIGSETFTSLIVEQVLTKHDSPSDLSRAVNIMFGLFHLDIESCALSLLRVTIPKWLLGEKKQIILNQPRAFALAHLTVMTLIEAFNNLKSSLANNGNQSSEADKKLNVNGIKQEPGQTQKSAILMNIDCAPGVGSVANATTNTNLAPNGPKRIKLSQDSHIDVKDNHQDATERLDRLNGCVANLMRLFKEITADSIMSQRTLFPILFLQQAVVCSRESSTTIMDHLEPEILLDIIKLFSSELTFELVLAISNLSTANSRKFAAKAMCQLQSVQ